MLWKKGGTSGGGGGGGISSVFDFVQAWPDIDIAVAPNTTKNITVFLATWTANHRALLPAPGAMHTGQRITFVDADGSLSGFFGTLDGNGSTINGLATFVIGAGTIGTSPGGGIGPEGAITLEYIGATLFAVVG